MLSEADVDIWWPVRLRALKEEPESFGADHDEAVVTPIADVAKRLRCSDDGFVLGAFNPDLVGMIGLFRRQGLKMRHKGTIWGMYVAPEGRGKKIGRALMLAAIERAKTIPDLNFVNLTVVTTNTAARSLYVSLGFKPYGIEPGALKLGDKLLDEEMLEITL